MMKELHLSIVSPEKSIFDGNVKIVTLPGMIGSFSILPGHAPIVSLAALRRSVPGQQCAGRGYVT